MKEIINQAQLAKIEAEKNIEEFISKTLHEYQEKTGLEDVSVEIWMQRVPLTSNREIRNVVVKLIVNL